jgi:hypothetical protein
MSYKGHTDQLETLPYTCSKRGIVATLENALSIRNNISRRNYTRASSQSAAQYFRIVRSS